ncbi:glucose 1-dehydrogenase 2 [Nannizzia gypsea CBS 118893]|uniref:Glucose 1-dehydrogenase 2 n=1 Tax=Arthroderma gypseum (strain ATCC MYA-4604 / CBS 118893) TaxID=535722 RepID=E4UQT2_ARTGP|nr:glucose 1-dehydrogenase 2 [Nannizzia gypsea CBS 118893]EFR00100.1 glucose 1-dehydrogenase 2 [Nannizzia gypsea CBS 118893]
MATGARLQNKIAIVTGSSDGIGRAIALRYAAEGAYVVCADLAPESRAKANDGELLKPTHKALDEKYPAVSGGPFSHRSIFIKTDVSIDADVKALVSGCVKEYGRLDIMVNNAGIGPNYNHDPTLRLHETPEHSWDRIMGVNGKGVWLGCKYAAAQMLAQEPSSTGDRGWIINTASVMGLVGIQCGSAYSASKGAVVNLTRAVALEYGADRIHVNAIAPGFVQTPLMEDLAPQDSGNPVIEGIRTSFADKQPFESRLAKAEEVASVAVFLASEDASFVTGHTLAVDGGSLAP